MSHDMERKQARDTYPLEMEGGGTYKYTESSLAWETADGEMSQTVEGKLPSKGHSPSRNGRGATKHRAHNCG